MRMRCLVVAAGWAALAVAACSASPPSAGEPEAGAPSSGEARSSAVEPASSGPSLYGRWRLVEVNGRAPQSVSAEPGHAPIIAFGPDGYGGSTGCNSFGGIGMRVGDRWFGDSPMQTEMGCGGALEAQEMAVIGVTSGGPTLSFDGPDALTLRTAKGVLRLRREGPLQTSEPSRTPEPPMLLAGTRWTLTSSDGAWLQALGGNEDAPELTFEADRWTLKTACSDRSGGWRQEDGALVLEGGQRTEKSCRPALTQATASLLRTLEGPLRYVVGGNGELVLANAEHWVAGRRDITLGREDPRLLDGQWRVMSVDGAAPPASERPAELGFGPGAYSVWDGCAHREGVAIVYSRQLFTLGSGVVTAAACPEDPLRTKINAVVADSPRFGRTADGGLALVSHSGVLALQKRSSQGFGAGIATQLSSGTAFDLSPRAGGTARLTLGPGNRFTIAFTCGTLQGRWRNDRSPVGRYSRFGPEPLPASCASDPIARSVEQFFTGDMQVAIGPNKDIALFVNERDRLPARVVR